MATQLTLIAGKLGATYTCKAEIRLTVRGVPVTVVHCCAGAGHDRHRGTKDTSHPYRKGERRIQWPVFGDGEPVTSVVWCEGQSTYEMEREAE